MTDPGQAHLDALTITVVVDNATDTLSSIAPGLPQLPELAYLLGGPSIGQPDGHECVFSACSHAGVVNVGLEALQLHPAQPVDLLLGGYHLAGGAVDDRIEPTVLDLTPTSPRASSPPGHCTGWRAASALADAFAPDHYARSVVGTRYVLGAG